MTLQVSALTQGASGRLVSRKAASLAANSGPGIPLATNPRMARRLSLARRTRCSLCCGGRCSCCRSSVVCLERRGRLRFRTPDGQAAEGPTRSGTPPAPWSAAWTAPLVCCKKLRSIRSRWYSTARQRSMLPGRGRAPHSSFGATQSTLSWGTCSSSSSSVAPRCCCWCCWRRPGCNPGPPRPGPGAWWWPRPGHGAGPWTAAPGGESRRRTSA